MEAFVSSDKVTVVHCGHGGRMYTYLGHGNADELIEKTRQALLSEIRATERALEALDARGHVTRRG